MCDFAWSKKQFFCFFSPELFIYFFCLSCHRITQGRPRMDLENLLITECFKQKGKIAVTLFHTTHAVPDRLFSRLVLVSVFALFGGGI